MAHTETQNGGGLASSRLFATLLEPRARLLRICCRKMQWPLAATLQNAWLRAWVHSAQSSRSCSGHYSNEVAFSQGACAHLDAAPTGLILVRRSAEHCSGGRAQLAQPAEQCSALRGRCVRARTPPTDCLLLCFRASAGYLPFLCALECHRSGFIDRQRPRTGLRPPAIARSCYAVGRSGREGRAAGQERVRQDQPDIRNAVNAQLSTWNPTVSRSGKSAFRDSSPPRHETSPFPLRPSGSC
jgi:hypothetical protein